MRNIQHLALTGLAAAAALVVPSAYATDFTDTAPVVASVPIFEHVNAPRQECWNEQVVTQAPANGGSPLGAIIGGIAGGVVGHQIGSGRGNDLATAGGAVAGAVVGSNVGRDGGGQTRTQDIQRCSETPSQARPEYWDVTYEFRGIEHRIQVTSPPGRTITVNEQGEPRA